jgi:hypothetical protein
MGIKRHLNKNMLLIIPMVLAIVIVFACNSGSSTKPSDSPDCIPTEEEMSEEQDEPVFEEHDDSPTAEDIEREERAHEVTDAGQVINNHFIALSKGDRQLLKSTVADVVTSYIGMSNVTPADIEKYMNSLHADSSQDIKYVIRHIIVNKETDGSTPHYKVHFSVTQIIRQGDKTGEHTFAGLSDINSEGKITSLILSQQS